MLRLGAYSLTAKHIEWAYVLPGEPGCDRSLELLRRVCTMLLSEIVRTDEIAVLFFQGLPLIVCKIVGTDAKTPDAATFDYPGVSWEPLFEPVRDLLVKQDAAIGLTALDLLLFRPQTHESFDIRERFGSYLNASRAAHRKETLVVAYSLATRLFSAGHPTCVAAAQLSSAVASGFSSSLSQLVHLGDRKRIQEQAVVAMDAVDGWTQGVYNEALEVEHFRKKNSYPIAPLPIEFLGEHNAVFDFHVASDEEVIEDAATWLSRVGWTQSELNQWHQNLKSPKLTIKGQGRPRQIRLPDSVESSELGLLQRMLQQVDGHRSLKELTARRYTDNKDFASWEYIALRLATQLALAVDGVREDESTLRLIGPAVRALQLKPPAPTLWLNKSLAEAFSHTHVPEPLPLVERPLRRFLLMLPNIEALYNLDHGYASAAIVEHFMPGESLEDVTLASGVGLEYSKIQTFSEHIIVITIYTDRLKMIRTTLKLDADANFGDAAELSVLSPSYDYDSPNEKDAIRQRDVVSTLVYQTILYLQTRDAKSLENPALALSSTPSEVVSARQKIQSYVSRRWVGADYEPPCKTVPVAEAATSRRGSGSHASPATHIRRGHYRQQAHGVELKERKLIWIEPTVVNL